MEGDKKKKRHDNHEEQVFPAEEQGILPEETSEDLREDMKIGEKDEDIYSKEGREAQEDEDEIEPWESGFAQGAANTGQLGKDALTGEPLMDVENVIELKLDGKIFRFVSEENAEKFKQRKNHS
jgi:hypothetical protein